MTSAHCESNEKLCNAMGEAQGIFIIERILHLGLMATDDAEANEAFEPFLSEFDDTVAKDLAGRIDLKRLEEFDDDELLEELLWEIHQQKRFGFLCYVRTPEVEKSAEGSKSYSWGLTHDRWFYDDDLAGIVQQANAWALSQEVIRP